MKPDLSGNEEKLWEIVKYSVPIHPKQLAEQDIRSIYFSLAERMSSEDDYACFRKGLETKAESGLSESMRDVLNKRGFVNAAKKLDYLLRRSSQEARAAASHDLVQYIKSHGDERSGRLDYNVSVVSNRVIMPPPFHNIASSTMKMGWGFDEFLFYLFAQGFVTVKTASRMVSVGDSERKGVDKVFNVLVIPKFNAYLDRKV